MDNKIRQIIEANIDNAIKLPGDHEKTFRHYVSRLGIEPNLDTVLSYFSGNLLGIFWYYYRDEYERGPNPEEIIEFHDLMKRRIWELRQIFLETRLNED